MLARAFISCSLGNDDAIIRNRSSHVHVGFGQLVLTIVSGSSTALQSLTTGSMRTSVTRYVAVMQISMRFTTRTPDDGPALIRRSTPLLPGVISVVMSAEYHW